MKLIPIGNKFTFTFIDSVVVKTDTGRRRTQFEEITNSGFVISSYDEGAKYPRWVIVKDVGDQVDPADFKQGSKVLVDALKWSDALEFDGMDIWYSDVTQVLAVED